MAKKWYDFFVVTDRAETTAAPKGPPGPEAPSPPRRAVDLVTDAAAETTFDGPVTDSVGFDEIYTAARIALPPHGYTILKVAEMLGSEHLRELPPDVKKKSILVALDAAGVSVDGIVEDAVQRDRALDTYERLLQKNLDELRITHEGDNRRIEAEIESRLAELRAQLEANRGKLRDEKSRLDEWRARKRVEEAGIAEAVSYFVTENPVSTTDQHPTHTGGDHVR
ncbi:MAG: hypothetical protein SGI90_07900 [Candidatus Eisenbacteria bacterium]|nr:hypothetical protein [Candidatus Eisenbacteria bacterium]